MRQAVVAAREDRRSRLVERIALAERRAIVRETIQKALVSQSRNDQGAERVMFTHPSQLGDGPGPGAYAPPSSIQTSGGVSFGPSQPAVSLKTHELQPGPGTYNPKRTSGLGGVTIGGRHSTRAPEELPGPGAYHYTQPASKGGAISRHRVKSQLDYAIERAAAEPGPGEYELAPLAQGKSSTLGGRTRGATDYMIETAARRPGPGEYDVGRLNEAGPRRVRGGAMPHDTTRKISSLPSIAPGPGAYQQTPTIQQEREMRMLSRQVLRLVKTRQLGGSAPEARGLARAQALGR